MAMAQDEWELYNEIPKDFFLQFAATRARREFTLPHASCTYQRSANRMAYSDHRLGVFFGDQHLKKR